MFSRFLDADQFYQRSAYGYGWLCGCSLLQLNCKPLFSCLSSYIMAPRNRASSRRPLWIIILIAFVCAVAIGAYLYTPRHYTACYLVPSEACNSRPPPEPVRVYTDDEIAARAIMRDIIRARPVQSKNPKIAFMFLTPSSLPFEKLWEKFFMVWFCSIAKYSKYMSRYQVVN